MVQRETVNSNISDLRARIRHSAAHLMADAVMQLFPEAKLGIGPPTADGFYYDLEVSRPFTPEDLEKVDQIMRETMAKDLPFVFETHERQQLLEMYCEQPYKLELIGEISSDEPLTTYSHGTFTDLCQGPHVSSTGEIPAFKLMSVAGAYWRGSEERPMLQRIYGTAFESQASLDEFLIRAEEADKRDHRKLGRQLGLFFFDPLAPASPFFLPKGAILYNLMVNFMQGLYQKYGYQEVITPQILSTDLWKRSGHYDLYLENMYFTTADEREFGVKPMNCPAACILYNNEHHSYRDLPLRYADFGRLHRYERSGVTHGLTRVRSFSQDDAHIFCRPDQVPNEVAHLMKMIRETYAAFSLGDPRIDLSLRPEKRGGSEEMWDKAEDILRDALISSGYSFEEIPGEGAFYGPKIDLFMHDAVGRDWQLGTVQLDLYMPDRFNLEYITRDSSAQRPIMIHRAILGSLERFMGVLIEHCAGAFPTWLAPVQAIVIPITNHHVEYGDNVVGHLRKEGFRVEMDARNERMNLKIRQAQLDKVPYMLVIGDRETEHGTASVRSRDNGNLGPLRIEEIVQLIQTP